MNDTVALVVRVVAIALFDWGLAFACGLLLAAYWLRGRGPEAAPVRVPKLTGAAVLMVVGLCGQFYVLTASMIDQAGLSEVLRAVPAIASMHAGSVTLWMLGAACVLVPASGL